MIYFFYLHTTIRPNTWLSFIYSFFNARLFNQKLGSTLVFFFHLYTTIRPKIRVFINLIFFLVHNHLTKVSGHSYFLIYYFLNCANIPFAIFKAVLSLYFVRSIHGGCSKPCCSYISYAILMSI